MTKSFKHSGDLGDIIYALPAIRAMGGGTLLLDPDGGQSSPLVKWADRTRTKLNLAGIESIRPLLLQQPYLQDVRAWQGEPVDHDADEFRCHHQYNNLSDAALAAFNLPFTERDRAWLTVTEPTTIPDRPIVLSRSVRYQGNHGFWERILPQIKNLCVYVGYPKEYEIFVYTFGHHVDYYPTANVLELARVIAGCEQFIGNEGLPRALAEGFKKRLINEVNRSAPGTLFHRPDAEYV